MFRQAILAAVFLLTCGAAAAGDNGIVARGKYLAYLGDCAGCHSRPNKPAFSGGLAFSASFGTLYSTNITPDRQTGIGNWTKDDFYRATHDGIAADGTHLYPAFPYIYFARISRADTDAIYAYLKTLKSVHVPPRKDKLLFPFDVRAGMTLWNAMFFHGNAFPPEPSKSAAWNRGNYIVNGLGHCAACHTPKNVMFGDEISKPLTGAVEEGWFSANLNGNKQDGLGKWSAADIVAYLKTGRNRFAAAAGTMQEKVTDSTSHMSDADLMAIAIYLKSLPVTPEAPLAAPDARAMQAGRIVFVENCSACHLEPGPAQDYPRLAGDTLVMGRNPTTVVRIILGGAESAVTANAQTTFSMPAFQSLSDADIANVATYIRNSWSNRASAVSAVYVAKLRKAILEEEH